MSRTARESRDPRTYTQSLPNVTAKENTRDKVRSYGLGFQDATNATVAMSDTRSGQRALNALVEGNPKPYRRLVERQNHIN